MSAPASSTSLGDGVVLARASSTDAPPNASGPGSAGPGSGDGGSGGGGSGGGGSGGGGSGDGASGGGGGGAGGPPQGPSGGGPGRPAPGRGRERLKAFHEEGAIQQSYDVRLLRRLWPFLQPHVRHVAFSLGMLVVVQVLGLVRPLIMGQVAGHAADRNASGLVRDGIVLAAIVVVTQLLSFAQVYTMQLAGARAMADLRVAIFTQIQRLRLRFFDKTPVGRLVTRATNDVDGLSELFASGVLNAAGDLLSLVGIVVAMLLLDWRMALIGFVALPVVGTIVVFMRRRSREAYRAIRARTARLNAFLNEQVSGIAVVQAFAREGAMAAEFDEINSAYRDANKAAVFYEAILDAAIEMVGTVCVASVLWWAGLQHGLGAVGVKDVTFSEVVVFTQYIKQFFEPISMLSQRYTVLQSALSGAERIFELLDEKDVEPDPELSTSLLPPSPDEAIAFENVTFGYKPGVPVLTDVTFTAKRGERIALVGATGAGKSTVASLLLRLYEPTAGTIRILGDNVRSLSPSELRRHFSVVPQDVFLFSGTILSNVAVSDVEPDRERVRTALARVGALDLFEAREGGLAARVDDRGSNFSAGERQLLAFARALYKDAPILVLDEATASVDSDTEARLQVALEAVLQDRTALVIAHRLSTIRAADRILVFHKGRIVESGRHEELLAKGGVYARLHRLQFAHDRAEGMSVPPPPVSSSASAGASASAAPSGAVPST